MESRVTTKRRKKAPKNTPERRALIRLLKLLQVSQNPWCDSCSEHANLGGEHYERLFGSSYFPDVSAAEVDGLIAKVADGIVRRRTQERERLDAFRAHLEECGTCDDDPAGMCVEGARLMKELAAA